VSGELKFTSPEVKNAAQTMADIWMNEDYVQGGPSAIVSTSFMNAPAGMFSEPPACWLHRQGNFITSFFPEGSQPGEDYDFFYFPPIDDEFGRPFLVAGDIYAMFADRPEVRAVMEFFMTGASLEEWLATGGALSPHNDTPLEWYGNPVEQKIAGLVRGATAVRFDASDMMPGEVGSGSFWTGMTNFVSGTSDLDTAMNEIDASWPK
jgi:alpha-glucoside transport system substrate-binding protein